MLISARPCPLAVNACTGDAGASGATNPGIGERYGVGLEVVKVGVVMELQGGVVGVEVRVGLGVELVNKS